MRVVYRGLKLTKLLIMHNFLAYTIEIRINSKVKLSNLCTISFYVIQSN